MSYVNRKISIATGVHALVPYTHKDYMVRSTFNKLKNCIDMRYTACLDTPHASIPKEGLNKIQEDVFAQIQEDVFAQIR